MVVCDWWQVHQVVSNLAGLSFTGGWAAPKALSGPQSDWCVIFACWCIYHVTVNLYSDIFESFWVNFELMFWIYLKLLACEMEYRSEQSRTGPQEPMDCRCFNDSASVWTQPIKSRTSRSQSWYAPTGMLSSWGHGREELWHTVIMLHSSLRSVHVGVPWKLRLAHCDSRSKPPKYRVKGHTMSNRLCHYLHRRTSEAWV